MADFWITFRLKDNIDYPRRYREFVAAIKRSGSNHWDEPTSFLAFESTFTLDAIGVFLKGYIDIDVDIFVLRQIGHVNTVYAGTPDKPALFRRYFPNAKKL